MKKMFFLLLLIPQICYGQMVVQNRDIKQSPATKLFISSNTPTIKDIVGSKTITAYNGAALSQAKIKTGIYSIYFDGLNDYANVGDATDADFAFDGDFTIDFWLYVASFKGNLIYSKYNSWSGSAIDIYCGERTSPTRLIWRDYIDVQPAANINATTWHHIAEVRYGTGSNNVKIYVNGILAAQATNSNSIPSRYQMKFATGPAESYSNFYIQDFRITKGKALWTSNFIPPRRSGAF